MSHQTSATLLHSLLDTFDPDSEHYQGVRDHFSAWALAIIDGYRAYPDDHSFTLTERLLISYALSKVVMTAENPA